MVTRESLFARVEPMRIGIAGRLIWLLALLIISFGVWASWAKIQQQVRVPGEVVTSSRSQSVQAVDGGVLKKLYVHEGEFVQEGELLAELDPTRFAARVAETRAKVVHLRAKVQRLRAELSGEPLDFGPKVEAWPKVVEAQTQLYKQRVETQRAKRESLKRRLSLARQQLSALETLARTGDAARSEVLNARSRVTELHAKLVNTRNNYRAKARSELAKALSALKQAEEVLKQRVAALEATNIRAPMTGTVKNIEVTTIGAVLKAGEEIMQIVPADDQLIVEARVSPKYVASVRPGLKANIKLDAYDYTIYGALSGKVTYVSPDTITENLKRGQQPYYRVLIEITEIPNREGAKPIKLIPGMTATIEIITGTRTVAHILLKPLIRGSDVALTQP